MTNEEINDCFNKFKSYKSYENWIDTYKELLYNLYSDNDIQYHIYYSPEHFCIFVEWESEYANLQLDIHENSFNFSIFNKHPVDNVLKIDSVYDLKQRLTIESLNLINQLVKTHFQYTTKIKLIK